MKVTLKDIAESTGYSISTISRVLSGSDKISTETKEKVLPIADKLGYKVSKNGNSTSTGTVKLALVASGFHEGEFYSSFFHGLNKASGQNNVRLFLTAVLDYEKKLIKMLKNLASEYYDGIILFVPELVRSDYEKIKSALPSNFPIISNSLIENPVFPTVTFDSYSGGYLAAKHFLELNYKKVGIILGPPERSESRFRKNGLVDFISQQSDMELVWSCDGDFTFESGVEACRLFHKERNKPDAVFASNDSMAQGFLETAKKLNYKIPEDVALLGYDDLPHNMHTNPTISSIHTDYENLGNTTIKALLEHISNKDLESGLLSFVPVSVSRKQST
ncbi:MAG: LacI family DNA-binding transcriptional regulator [Balneolaceae bacterium]